MDVSILKEKEWSSHQDLEIQGFIFKASFGP